MIVDGAEGWYMYQEKYVRDSVENTDQNIMKYNQHLPTRCKTPTMTVYCIETDTQPNIKAEGMIHCQEMVGVIRWVVELGRVDIILETEIMSTYLALPHRVHL